MSSLPAFTVRSYPAFRMARMHRVYVDRDVLYLIRMRGVVVIAVPDADCFFFDDPFSDLLRWWARRSQRSAARELDERGPREMLEAHRQNRRFEAGDIASSRLEPARLLVGHGTYLARWTLTPRGRKAMTFQIEDSASLRTALAVLPGLLGPALSVTVAWDMFQGGPVRVKEARAR
jgi:hypothetical protein